MSRSSVTFGNGCSARSARLPHDSGTIIEYQRPFELKRILPGRERLVAGPAHVRADRGLLATLTEEHPLNPLAGFERGRRDASPRSDGGEQIVRVARPVGFAEERQDLLPVIHEQGLQTLLVRDRRG